MNDDIRFAWSHEMVPGALVMVPLWQRFGANGPYVELVLDEPGGKWDLEALLKTLRQDAEWVRMAKMSRSHAEPVKRPVYAALACLDKDTFVKICERGKVYLVAEDPERAEELLKKYQDRFFTFEGAPEKPAFFVIKCESYGWDAARVEVRRPFAIGDELLSMYYGDGFTRKNQHIVDRLRKGRQGVTIFQGAPGTGKTTYIRMLMWVLRETHHFYTIPLSEFAQVTSNRLTHFWLERKEMHPKHTLVMVIEDAEDLIRGDAHQRNAGIAALLNLSDGLLGEFLELQIILTANCPISDIDPAITRKGRLIAHHEFKTLPLSNAREIARHHKLGLSSDKAEWTLADIFNAEEEVDYQPPAQAKVGFGPSGKPS